MLTGWNRIPIVPEYPEFNETVGDVVVPLMVPAIAGLISQLKDVANGSAPLRLYRIFKDASQTWFGPLTIPEGKGRGITLRLDVARLVQLFAPVYA